MRPTRFVSMLGLLTACGDNVHPDEDQISIGAEEGVESVPDTTVPTLRTFFLTEPSDCADNSARLMGRVFYADGPLVETATCHYDFGDGTSAFGCFQVHSFPTQRPVTLTARDPATGAIASYTETVVGPRNLTATLDVTTDGLTISWDATALYGDNTIDVHLSFEPADKVIIDDPAILMQPTGTVRVTEAGAYKVTNHATVSFGEVGSCGTFAEQTVDVTCEANH